MSRFSLLKIASNKSKTCEWSYLGSKACEHNSSQRDVSVLHVGWHAPPPPVWTPPLPEDRVHPRLGACALLYMCVFLSAAWWQREVSAVHDRCPGDGWPLLPRSRRGKKERGDVKRRSAFHQRCKRNELWGKPALPTLQRVDLLGD